MLLHILHTAALSWDRSLPPPHLHQSPPLLPCRARMRPLLHQAPEDNYGHKDGKLQLPGGTSRGIRAKRLRSFSFIWIFHWWIFNRKSPAFLFCTKQVHSSTQQPNFLLKKKLIRKLPSRSQAWQLVEIAQILSRKPSYDTSISGSLCIPLVTDSNS